MKIDGKSIASIILESLKAEVQDLKEKEIVPTLAVILIGDEKSSAAYVRQKELKAKEIGARIEIFRFNESVANSEIETLIIKLDEDTKIHGIIIQRPAPKHIEIDSLEDSISSEKEVDGFGKYPIYPVPVAEAVLLILEDVYIKQKAKNLFPNWLKSKKMAVLGTGETAGGPIINYFREYGTEPVVIDSKTESKDSLMKEADIIISAVGKTIINSSNIKKGVILIGVGMHMKDSKLHGDYNEEEIKNIAGFYTPTPGGVGPVNVAMLLSNLVEACQNSMRSNQNGG
ncbi:MAG: bifunctional 5,10-methylenetetrahydrofolate dehydrogenase/5,10-methenyltetrahydrofolate cyclohydrolase [Patescibacteria group bacterium]|nr:bifunctional 5,10-methylenetetrahydrofolate dehydrogenase/5,10-methenyltetrahydrofolate cyclohydrolase [Patescibacteria group bacterium]